MSRAQLLAFAVTLSTAGAGIYLYRTSTGELSQSFPSGGIELLDVPASWSDSPCAAQACTVAVNWLTDAGMGSVCSPRLYSGPVRIGRAGREWLADAGFVVGAQRYQQAQLLGLRCVGADGGFARAPPMRDVWYSPDAGGSDTPYPGALLYQVPQFASYTQLTPPCVRAPVTGGTGCQRSEHDGGFRYFGAGNVFPAGLSNGDPSCQAVSCSVMYGDDPDVGL